MNFTAVIKILRPLNLIITFFSVIIAAVISASFSELDLNTLFIALSVTFSFAGGNVINDIIDYEIDKINRPERVLPQGFLSISSAKKIYSITIFISLLFSAIVSLQYLVILITLNLMLFLYSTHLKKIILLSNITVAFATAFPLVLGGMIVNNIEGGLIPAGFAFFTNFIREIIKDIEDIKGDSQKAVKTFPQKFGIRKSIYFAVLLIISLMILTLFPFLLRIYSAEYFLIIMVVVNPIFVYTLKLLFGNPDLKTFRKISSLIKVEYDTWSHRDSCWSIMKTFDRSFLTEKVHILCGVDEAGRGPLAGPVVAAAVVFDEKTDIPGIDDSKKLDELVREELYEEITRKAERFSIGVVDHIKIDEINILNASLLAMKIAVKKIAPKPHLILIDGNKTFGTRIKTQAIIGGDAKSFSIAAASIVAKVTRDRMMKKVAKSFPYYAWHTNKGYATREHIKAILQYGPCELHRKTFLRKILLSDDQLKLDQKL